MKGLSILAVVLVFVAGCGSKNPASASNNNLVKFTANMLARTGPTGNLLLYAKVRSKVDTHEQAFWGLNIAQLASLKAAHLPWWVALPPRPRRDRLSLARAVRAPRNHPSCVVPRSRRLQSPCQS